MTHATYPPSQPQPALHLTTTDILREIESQIDRLTQARALLCSSTTAGLVVAGGGKATFHPITFPAPAPAPNAKLRRAARRHAELFFEGPPSSSPRPVRRQLSPASRDRISRAQKKRWRAFHRAQKQGAA